MIRKLELLIVSVVIVVAAFSTALPFLFYLLYLAILVIGGSYVLVRLGLSDLEAGYAVSQLHGHVGDRMRVTYTLRNTSRVPKLWLEIHNPTTLPGGLPGRAITLGARAERSWLIRAPLSRRGHFRIEPLHIRTGDPFGFFEASATVGQGISIVVYPRLEPLPRWHLPAAALEGSHASPVRTLQTTPMATSVRPYAPGDAMNRIHWKTTARHGEIQVKEFDLEQTADAWIILDLQRGIQTGRGDESTVEAAVRAAASIADRALQENRAVGMTVNVGRTAFLPPDRGGRQHLKIMQLLAAVEADGSAPLVETLITTVGRLRRGMTAVIITASLDPAWVRPLASLRTRGVACVVVTLDASAFAKYATKSDGTPIEVGSTDPEADELAAKRGRALRHALAEYELRSYVITPGRPLGEILGPMNRRIPLAPSEGWITLGLVVVMGLSLAWAIDDARWVLGRAENLDLLVVAAIGGVLAGFIGPKVGWGRWLTYLIGSIFAALIVPLLVGLVGMPGGGSIHDLYVTTAASVVQAYIDLAVLNLAFTSQYLHYIFVLGMLVWATCMFASYAVFGHHRPLNAVIVVGIILVGNMSFTFENELKYLILFSIASLFLLIRSHVYDEQAEWLRRRIGDPTSISSVYLRGGTVFIVVAVISSFVLTQTAASAPLAGAWDGVEDGLLTLSRSVSRFLPTGGSTRPVGLSFGSNTQVEQQWNTDPGVAVTIQRDPNDTTEYYWRAYTYDRLDLKGWALTKADEIDVGAGQPILAGLAENPDPTGLRSFSFTVTPEKFRLPTMLSPATPASASENVKLTTAGASGYFGTLDRSGGQGGYKITAMVAVPGNDPGQLNESALESASTTYPDDIKALYLTPLPARMLETDGLKLEAKILAEAKSDAPYDIARAAEHELQSSAFTYNTDVRHLECQTLSVAECFARFKEGFCQYYATTMAAILRDVDIPARIVEGFLPGDLDTRTGIETIQFSKAHAWVEVYFPGYGWVRFDPTSPSVSRAQVLPSGPPRVSAAPRASSSVGPIAELDPRREIDPNPGGFLPPTDRGSLGPLVGIGLLLLVVVLAVAFLAWRRGPRGPVSADGAYGSVTRLASRFGFGPRPAQTVYEYATSLGDVLPDVRPELQTVARAKVESTYAREILGDARMASLRAAQRRLRVSLLRLAFRRKDRPRRR